MRSVARSAEPDFFAALRAAHSRWDDLDGAERNRIRNALVRDFGAVCAYCQCPCTARPESDDDLNAETVDHFRPRHLFPAQWLDWPNLGYVDVKKIYAWCANSCVCIPARALR